MIHNLGEVLTIVARAEAAHHFIDADLAAFHAPSECYADAHRHDAARARLVRRLAESVARRPFRVIAREAARRGMPLGSPRWQSFVGRIYVKTFPF
jgi:hypothetical protein